MTGRAGAGGRAEPDERAERLGGSAFLGSAAVTLAGSGVGAAFTVVNESLAAHILGPSGYGLYALAMMLTKVGEILALFGLPLAILHYLPVHLDRSEPGAALGVIVGGSALPVLLGLGFAAGLWSGAGWIALGVFQQPGAAPFIAIIGLAIPALALADLLGNVARGLGRPVTYVLIRNVIPPLCYLASLLYIVRAGAADAAVARAYWAATATGALTGVVLVGQLVRRRIGRVAPEFRLRRLYAYSTPVAINAVFSIAIVWTDLLLLGIYSEAAIVGMYRACMQVVIAFDLVWNACSAATAPIYPVLVAGGEWRRLQQAYGSAIRLATLLASPLCAIVLVNAGDILGLLHPEFRPAATALSLLAAGQAVKAAFGAASILLVVGGGPTREAANGASAAVLNLLLNLLLVPRFGLVGAATATATTLVAISVLRCWQVWRTFGVSSLDRPAMHAALLSGLVALVVGTGSGALGIGNGSGYAIFAARLVVMGTVLAATLWWVCLGREDRIALAGLLARRRPVISGTAK